MNDEQNTEKMLQPFADTQVKQITRYEKKSISLKNESILITIDDATALKEALDKRKEINSHVKEVSDTRFAITREFDKVKTQFTDAEKRVIKPAAEAKEIISKKIIEYEAKLEKLRKEEEQRITAITDQFISNTKSFRTLKSVDEHGAELKKLYSELPVSDQANGVVKLAFTEAIVKLNERKDDIRTAEVSEAEQAKIAAKRRRQLAIAEQEKAEAEKAAAKVAKKAPKTGVRMVTKFTIIDALEVPLEYCIPSEPMIRAAIANGVTEIPGVKIYKEASF